MLTFMADAVAAVVSVHAYPDVMQIEIPLVKPPMPPSHASSNPAPDVLAGIRFA